MIQESHYPYLSKENENRISGSYLHPHVHCSFIHNSQDMETPKCPSTNEWIKEMWHISAMEYHSTRTKEEILPFATMWMHLENLMFSETSHTEEDKQCVVSLRCSKVQLP